VLLAAASSASAAPTRDVWLWACHGPSGEALNTSVQPTQNYDGKVTGDCSAAGSALTFTLPPTGGNVAGASKASATFPSIPANTVVSQVRLNRSFTGFDQAGAGPISFFAKTNKNTFESAAAAQAAPADGVKDASFSGEVNHGDALQVGIECTNGVNNPCAAGAPVAASVPGAAIRVSENVTNAAAEDDTTAPRIAVGGVSNPMADRILPNGVNDGVRLDVHGTDTGVGLDYAEAFLSSTDGTINITSGRNSFGDCQDIAPSTPALDLPLGVNCPTVGAVELQLRTRGAIPNGMYNLTVNVYDLTGRKTTFTQANTEILNDPNLGRATQELSIGTSGISTPPNTGTNTGSSGGGVAGATSTSCNSPRLSVVLAQRPVRISKGVPVLRYNKRYRFSGRLTCVINGKRHSAPKRARIDLQNIVGKKTYDKSGTTTASKGRFSTILVYKSSRTLVFRFTNTNGQRSQVKIKIKVEKKKKAKR